MDERGVDPVIAVLLLVALTVFLGVGFFVWSRAYLSKTSTQGSSEQICSSTQFISADFCYSTVLTTNVNTNTQEWSTRIRFDVENDASENISSFLLVVDEESGNSTIISTIPYSEAPSIPGGKQLTSDFLSNTSPITEVHVSPQVELNGQNVNCYEEEQVIKAGDITLC